MANFITGKELEEAIYNIIWKAQQTLMIVSPYIKLDDYFKKLFDKHANNPKLHFVIVFGKNEGNVSRSLSKADFDYFNKFMNISIVYVPNLHAKYYGNETCGVISSINLYDYSFKNNIEFGVYSENNFLNLTTTADQKAWETCWEIANTNQVVFIKRPVYEKKLLSSLLGKNYIKSDILHDITDHFYSRSFTRNQNSYIRKLADFPDELELGSESMRMPRREEIENSSGGFCIRTGKKIPFNPQRPLCDSAYNSWIKFSNPNYPEKYCHKTGVSSKGKTSVANPIL
jgi:hypothetical protein